MDTLRSLGVNLPAVSRGGAFTSATNNMNSQIAGFERQNLQEQQQRAAQLAEAFKNHAANLQARAQMQTKLLEQQFDIEKLQYTEGKHDERSRLDREQRNALAVQAQIFSEQMETMREAGRMEIEEYRSDKADARERRKTKEENAFKADLERVKHGYGMEQEEFKAKNELNKSIVGAVHAMYNNNLDNGMSVADAWNFTVATVGKHAGFTPYMGSNSRKPTPKVAADIRKTTAESAQIEQKIQKESEFGSLNEVAKWAPQLLSLAKIHEGLNEQIQTISSTKTPTEAQIQQLDELKQAKKQNILLQGLLGSKVLQVSAQMIQSNPGFANDPNLQAAMKDSLGVVRQQTPIQTPPSGNIVSDAFQGKEVINPWLPRLAGMSALIPGPHQPAAAMIGLGQLGMDVASPEQMMSEARSVSHSFEDSLRNVVKAHPEILKNGLEMNGIQYHPKTHGTGIDSFMKSMGGHSMFMGQENVLKALQERFGDFNTSEFRQQQDKAKIANLGRVATGATVFAVPMVAGKLLQGMFGALAKNPKFVEEAHKFYLSAGPIKGLFKGLSREGLMQRLVGPIPKNPITPQQPIVPPIEGGQLNPYSPLPRPGTASNKMYEYDAPPVPASYPGSMSPTNPLGPNIPNIGIPRRELLNTKNLDPSMGTPLPPPPIRYRSISPNQNLTGGLQVPTPGFLGAPRKFQDIQSPATIQNIPYGNPTIPPPPVVGNPLFESGNMFRDLMKRMSQPSSAPYIPNPSPAWGNTANPIISRTTSMEPPMVPGLPRFNVQAPPIHPSSIQQLQQNQNIRGTKPLPPTTTTVSPQGSLIPEGIIAVRKLPKGVRSKIADEMARLPPSDQLRIVQMIESSFVV